MRGVAGSSTHSRTVEVVARFEGERFSVSIKRHVTQARGEPVVEKREFELRDSSGEVVMSDYGGIEALCLDLEALLARVRTFLEEPIE